MLVAEFIIYRQLFQTINVVNWRLKSSTKNHQKMPKPEISGLGIFVSEFEHHGLLINHYFGQGTQVRWAQNRHGTEICRHARHRDR